MANIFSGSWSLIRQTASEWSKDKVPQLGAALAYYTALSIAPLLVISLSIVALIYGQEAASGQVQTQLQSLVGDEGAKAIQQMIESANKPTEGSIATVLSFV